MKKNYKKERHAPYIRYAHRTTKLKKILILQNLCKRNLPQENSSQNRQSPQINYNQAERTAFPPGKMRKPSTDYPLM